MVSEAVVTAAGMCQIATTFISLSAYVPQWSKLHRTKSSANISVRSWCLWLVSSSFGVFYATVQLLLNRRGWPLVLSTCAGLAFVMVTLLLVLKFRRAGVPPADSAKP
jgi:uncharacterized protein with PQ loop repeat